MYWLLQNSDCSVCGPQTTTISITLGMKILRLHPRPTTLETARGVQEIYVTRSPSDSDDFKF